MFNRCDPTLGISGKTMLLSFRRDDRRTAPFGEVIVAWVEGGRAFGLGRTLDGEILSTIEAADAQASSAS